MFLLRVLRSYPAHLLATLMIGLAIWPVSQAQAQSTLQTVPADADIAQGASEIIQLWPALPPGADKATLDFRVPHIATQRPGQDPGISDIARPVIAVYRPAKPDGSAVLLIPGGGYRHLAVGPGVARWLAGRGTTTFVLIYRLAQDGWAGGPDTPLQDAQRAMRLMRANAARWQLDPARLGVMGTSAGGHVAGQLITRFDATIYTPVDASDSVSARPDFASLNYAVGTMQGALAHGGSRTRLLGANPSAQLMKAYSNEELVRPDMPPVFLIHAADDATVAVDNSIMMFSAIRKVKVDTALYIFEKGGHGFGLGSKAGATVQAWPSLFIQWGASHAMFRE